MEFCPATSAAAAAAAAEPPGSSQKLAGAYSMHGLPCSDQATFCGYPDALNSYATYSYAGMDTYMPMNKSRPTPYSRNADYPTYLSRMAGLTSSGLSSSGLAPARTSAIPYDNHYGTGQVNIGRLDYLPYELQAMFPAICILRSVYCSATEVGSDSSSLRRFTVR